MPLDSSFGLVIDLTEREHSKDSHANRFEVRVDGSRVHYCGPYGEGTRGRFETETISFELSDQQRSTLELQLDNYDLRQSVQEHYETTAADAPPEVDDVDWAPFRAVEAEATVVADGQRHDLEIEGKTNVRGRETGMEHHQQARGLTSLCWQSKRWAEDAGAWWNPFEP